MKQEDNQRNQELSTGSENPLLRNSLPQAPGPRRTNPCDLVNGNWTKLEGRGGIPFEGIPKIPSTNFKTYGPYNGYYYWG